MKVKSILVTTIAGFSMASNNYVMADGMVNATSAATAPSAPVTAAPAAKPDLSTAQKQSYSIGYMQGAQIKSLRTEIGLELDANYIQKGMNDAMNGADHLLTEDQMKDALDALRKEIMEKEREKMNTMFEKNKTDSIAFMDANAKKSGVVTLKDNLQYEVVTASKQTNAKSPTLHDTVVVKYTGTLISGETFDTSGDSTATLAVNGVIKGWQEALKLMKPGDHWKLYIPADLAYGERGAPPKIMPNSALIFDLELVSIEQSKKGAGKKEHNKEHHKK